MDKFQTKVLVLQIFAVWIILILEINWEKFEKLKEERQIKK